MTNVKTNVEPWHRNPWVWLLIAIPALTIAGCIFTLYLALANPHILISDNVPPDQSTGNPDTGER